MAKLLFTGGELPKPYEDRLRQHGIEVHNNERADLSEGELIEELNGVQAYILGGEEKVTEKVLRQAKDLKLVAFFGAGYESYIDVDAATQLGIAVSNTPSANARSVAEFTVALILSALKKLPYGVNIAKTGNAKTYRTWNLYNGVLGIIGIGAIGSEVAKIAHNGFGMQILYVSRSAKPELEHSLGATKVTLDEALKSSNVITLHATYNDQTVGMLGMRELELMKPDAILVNTARAELIDPDALKVVLEKGHLWAYGADVYYSEPIPSPSDDPYGLTKMPDERVLLTPHTAYRTSDAVDLMASMNVESVLAILSNKDVPYIVNPDYRNYSR